LTTGLRCFQVVAEILASKMYSVNGLLIAIATLSPSAPLERNAFSLVHILSF
jgi:hypothetical protein